MSYFVFPKFLQVCPSCLQWRTTILKRQLKLYSLSRRTLSQGYQDIGQYPSSSDTDSSSDSDEEYKSWGHSETTQKTSLDYDQLYHGHIPTTPLQKTLLTVGAAATAIASPWRGDMVATLGETTGHFALTKMRQKMLADEIGRQILKEQPKINTDTVDLNELRALPEGTFGKVYASWLDSNKASPDERLPVTFVDDPDLVYVMRRYREIHDLFHTILGMPTNMLGEIVVKWVEAIQLGLPMCALGALFGPVRLGPRHMQMYLQTHLWWAIKNGRQARFLMNIYYEKHWDWPLEDLRRHLNIDEPPKTPPRKL